MSKYCSSCNRSQSKGSFCLDCGQTLEERKVEKKSFRPINTRRSSDTLKADIRKWLERVGCAQTDIQITANGMYGEAEVMYLLDGTTYAFKSFNQSKVKDNLAAVEQFLHARVLGIERGIESVEQAFAGYAALESPDVWVRKLSDADLRGLLKLHHPDTGDGNLDKFDQLRAEQERRKQE